MWRYAVAVCAGVVVGETADVVMSKRFAVMPSPEKTAAVLTCDDDGAGRLEVNDVNGKVAFSVKSGKVEAPCIADLTQRVQMLEKLVGVHVLQPAAAPALPEGVPKPGSAPNAEAAQGFFEDLKFERFISGDKYTSGDGLLGGKWLVAFKVRNVGSTPVRSMPVKAEFFDEQDNLVCDRTTAWDSKAKVEYLLYISLAPGESRVIEFVFTREEQKVIRNAVWEQTG